MNSAVYRTINDFTDFSTKLIAGRKTQAAVNTCQNYPRGFDNRNGFFAITNI